ncbi:hypothetical protein C8R45DRAFT_1114262 [Mycena sanguinolenta]|nr:hypothetical protein C8R45DRAFT_1114262 [Mycena sanguinolenta]
MSLLSKRAFAGDPHLAQAWTFDASLGCSLGLKFRVFCYKRPDTRKFKHLESLALRWTNNHHGILVPFTSSHNPLAFGAALSTRREINSTASPTASRVVHFDTLVSVRGLPGFLDESSVPFLAPIHPIRSCSRSRAGEGTGPRSRRAAVFLGRYHFYPYPNPYPNPYPSFPLPPSCSRPPRSSRSPPFSILPILVPESDVPPSPACSSPD